MRRLDQDEVKKSTLQNAAPIAEFSNKQNPRAARSSLFAVWRHPQGTML
jgi:hypothetical protein